MFLSKLAPLIPQASSMFLDAHLNRKRDNADLALTRVLYPVSVNLGVARREPTDIVIK